MITSKDTQNLVKLYESVHNNSWSELMLEIEELKQEDEDFDLVDYIWNINDLELYDLIPEIYSDYFGNPEKYDGIVYHSTNEDNLESIKQYGLRPESRSRGITNKGVGAAIFSSYEPDELGTYGDILIEIDLKKARELNPKLQTGLEPPVEEFLRRSAIANKLGIENSDIFMPSQSDGVYENTLIIYGNVPKDAIEIIPN
jgi:hypothetical protein